jgi:hypothetical protein
MGMTRCTGGDSSSQGLELGGDEPSAHGRQTVRDSAEVVCEREPWNVMGWASRVDMSVLGRLSCGQSVYLEKVGTVALVAGERLP